MVHELLGVVGTDGVQRLLHGQRGQGGDGEHLGLTSGEQAASVCAREFADATGDGSDFIQATAIGPHVLVEDSATDLGFDQVLEGFGDFAR